MIWLLRLINAAFVVFIYLNVLFPQWSVSDISISKSALAVSLLLYGLYAAMPASQRPPTGSPYVPIAFTMMSVLALIGVVKGSSLPDVWVFVSPLLMLLAIPLIQVLTDRYGRTPYLRHIVLSVSALAAYVVYIYLLKGPLRLGDDSLPLLGQSGVTSISFPGGAPKVAVVSAGFFPAGLVAAYYLSMGRRASGYYLPILLIATAAYIGQTLGIWIGSVFAMVSGVLMIRGSVVRPAILWTCVTVIAILSVRVAISGGDAIDPMRVLDTKTDSIVQKQTQTNETLQVFLEAPLFGRGLGHRYHMSEIASLSDFDSVYIEASFVMILASTGLVGLAVYAFIYLYYPLIYFFGAPKNGPNTVMAISHCAVLLASVGLPYMWSGGMGLFFVAFLAAWINSTVPSPVKSPQRQMWSRPSGRPAYDPMSRRTAVTNAQAGPARRSW